MNLFDLVGLAPLMLATEGRSSVVVGVVDGPVAFDHPSLLRSPHRAKCSPSDDEACLHGTFVTSILLAPRGAAMSGICPGCRVFLRPVFGRTAGSGRVLWATAYELAAAIVDCVDAGADVVNLSVFVHSSDDDDERQIENALAYAMGRNVLVVAAAGNQGSISTSVLTRHHWVVPVTACDAAGRPSDHSNVAPSIGRNGLAAPGEGVPGLSVRGDVIHVDGTSAAAPFVSGAIALLLSLLPDTSRASVRAALRGGVRGGIVPPLLDAAAVHSFLAQDENHHGRLAGAVAR